MLDLTELREAAPRADLQVGVMSHWPEMRAAAVDAAGISGRPTLGDSNFLCCKILMCTLGNDV